MDVPALSRPEWPSHARVQLRFNLIHEEYWELRKALGVREDYGAHNPNGNIVVGAVEDRDFVETADALADLIYVLVGTMLEFGIGPEVWDEVQRSNMDKRDPATGKVHRRPDGKVLKREGWTPPNIERVLREQGWIPQGKIVDLRREQKIFVTSASGNQGQDWKVIVHGDRSLHEDDFIVVRGATPYQDQMLQVLSVRYWEDEGVMAIRGRLVSKDAWSVNLIGVPCLTRHTKPL